MCTAATYKTKDFYIGRTLDYEFSYGEEVAVMPRAYPLAFRTAIRSITTRLMRRGWAWPA